MRPRLQQALTIALTALALAGPLSAANRPRSAGAPRSPVALDKRYTDAVNGFSLRPPGLMQRKREYSPVRLVSWLRRDAKTGAIDLAVTVLRRTEQSKKIDLTSYSKTLLVDFVRRNEFDVESFKLTKVDGHDAMDFRGRPIGATGMWKRQVWIWSGLGYFLIVEVSGPRSDRQRLESLSQAVVDTVRVFDPTAALKARRARLERGKSLLAGLTDKKLQAVFSGGRRWFLMRKGARDVGWMAVSMTSATKRGERGYEVQVLVKLNLPDDKSREVQRRLFSTADRNTEHWRENVIVGLGPKPAKTVEIGAKLKEAIVCTFTGSMRGEKQHSTHMLDGGIYLPRAFGMVLPQLVDLKRKESYAFATYASATNNFDLRTFTVIGPEEIDLRGRKIKAIRSSDRLADDAEPATVWTDSAGLLLRMKTSDGLEIEKSTESAIRRRFQSAVPARRQ